MRMKANQMIELAITLNSIVLNVLIIAYNITLETTYTFPLRPALSFFI